MNSKTISSPSASVPAAIERLEERQLMAADLRVATFNASLNRFSEGALVQDLSTPNNAQAKTIAEIIQRSRPDVVLINEFDYVPDGQAARLFRQNYLLKGQNGVSPINYPYYFIAPSNTGIASGFDLNNNGTAVTTPGAPGYGDDALGFGNFVGQFGMVVYSKFPIINEQVRTFQNFLWKDMPGALLPDDAATPAPGDFYSPAELEKLPLSSKSHWDLPINVNGRTLHVLAAHPTPPVFDGPEDRNGRRNHDEIRLWKDYITGGPASGYIYDDEGNAGGLAADSRFVIVGDYNADPLDGDSYDFAIDQFLDSPLINTGLTPSSEGAVEQATLQGGANTTHLGDPKFDTADFADTTPGNLRADYVLPSANIDIEDARVFWPKTTEPTFPLAGTFPFPSSDHRLVWADLDLDGPKDAPKVDTMPAGVSSGDVTQSYAVVWAQSVALGKLRFEVSTSPTFAGAKKLYQATVTNPDKPVKALAAGLSANTRYYYRAIDVAGTIKKGTFKTAARDGVKSGLTFGVSGDWRGELSPFSALRNVPAKNLDLFVKLGDTVYADVPSPGLLNADGTRKPQAITLGDYRKKHAEVYGPRFGQNWWEKVHASTPILATIDDHEVTNDFAGGAPISSDPRFSGANPTSLINDSSLYENGILAFQDWNAIRDDQFYGPSLGARFANERKLYRFNTFGADAATFVLDARSFRDTELPGVANPLDPAQVGAFLGASFDPTRTMLGRPQVDDLKRDLKSAQDRGVTWKFVIVPEPIQNLGVVGAADRFEGYAAERTEILKYVKDQGIKNVVFIAADIHGTVVNNLTYQESPVGPQIATGAWEISTGAVAYDAPFGPTVAQLAVAAGLISGPQKAFYDSLPVANDADNVPNDKDDFIKSVVDGAIAPLGYDPVGLNNNLPQAAGLIDATLVSGDYVATHTYGWTQFKINKVTQELRVTTYGIAGYSESQLASSASPVVVSEFVVKAQV